MRPVMLFHNGSYRNNKGEVNPLSPSRLCSDRNPFTALLRAPARASTGVASETFSLATVPGLVASSEALAKPAGDRPSGFCFNPRVGPAGSITMVMIRPYVRTGSLSASTTGSALGGLAKGAAPREEIRVVSNRSATTSMPSVSQVRIAPEPDGGGSTD